MRPTRWAAIVLALSAPVVAGADTPCRISEIREETMGPATHVIIAGPRTYAYRSPNARTVVLELPGCLPGFDPSTLLLSSPVFTSSRLMVGVEREGSELELQLRPGATYSIFEAPGGIHFVVDGPPGAEPTAEPEPPASEPIPVIVEPVPAPTAEPEVVPVAPTAEPEPVAMATPEPAAVTVVATPEPTSEPEPEPTTAPTAVAATPEPTATPEAPIVSAEEPSAPPVVVPDGPATRILAIRVEQREGETVITIDADGRIESYRDFRVPGPERVAVDLRGLTIARSVPATQAAGSLQVRAAQFKRSPVIARVVLDLASRLPYRIVAEGRSLSIIVSME